MKNTALKPRTPSTTAIQTLLFILHREPKGVAMKTIINELDRMNFSPEVRITLGMDSPSGHQRTYVLRRLNTARSVGLVRCVGPSVQHSIWQAKPTQDSHDVMIGTMREIPKVARFPAAWTAAKERRRRAKA